MLFLSIRFRRHKYASDHYMYICMYTYALADPYVRIIETHNVHYDLLWCPSDCVPLEFHLPIPQDNTIKHHLDISRERFYKSDLEIFTYNIYRGALPTSAFVCVHVYDFY